MFSCCAAETTEGEQFPATTPQDEFIEPVRALEEPAAIEPEAPPSELPKQEAPAVTEPEAPPAEVPKQESSAEFTEFEVVVRKSPERKLVGLHLDCSSSKALAVKGISASSLIGDWNAANPDKKVQIGDGILRVNVADTAADMVNALKEETVLTLVIRRVPEFVVCVDKTEGDLGIKFNGIGTDPATISQVHGGKLIFFYNQEAEAGKAVVPGDIVVDVNGVKGNMDEIVAAIRKTSGVVKFYLRHPAA